MPTQKRTKQFASFFFCVIQSEGLVCNRR